MFLLNPEFARVIEVLSKPDWAVKEQHKQGSWGTNEGEAWLTAVDYHAFTLHRAFDSKKDRWTKDDAPD